MSQVTELSSEMLAPVGGGTAPNAEQLLSGTGTTESNNSTVLGTQRMATLKVGNASIRVSFRAATGAADQVALDSMLLQAGERFDWYVMPDTCVVYAQAGDAVSAYQAWVWNSSP